MDLTQSWRENALNLLPWIFHSSGLSYTSSIVAQRGDPSLPLPSPRARAIVASSSFKRCQWNSTRVQIAYANDRSTDTRALERTRECRDFIWPDGTRSFAEFVSRDGSRLCRGVRGRGVAFRRSIVQRWRNLATLLFLSTAATATCRALTSFQ